MLSQNRRSSRYDIAAALMAAVFVVICATARGQLPEPPAAVPEREIAAATAEKASPEDIQYFESLAKKDDAGGAIARAALYKYDPQKYKAVFQEYFKINRDLPKVFLADTEVNERVNSTIKEFHGRSPLEIAARVYLVFRGSGAFFKKADGTELSLEVMFRAALFQGVLKKNLDEELHMAAEADGK